ncbi:MBOAT, membrane-bound O-acyltransferase family-domain-containing protein [Exophiala viscosa]|uniref:MBOAT, membrane-bound O-acyltransferase family-domain-containing protein n=1 Tax=Exophiala viscosa TaxID=2486360 RepID=A0AAN6IB11_9EURO|nr:MBOAT, membrane-bound O-acyltransferase family-domain-containing protein [Exophiala viscosa]
MLPGINVPFSFVAKSLGASVDEVKLLSTFLISYPLAAVLKRLPDKKPAYRNLFSVGITLFFLVGLFDHWDGIWTLSIDAAATYAIAYYIDGSLMPWIVFFFLMGHMSISHIQRQTLNDPSVVDITGGQMVLIMKLHAFSWNVHDGRLKSDLLTDAQKDRAIYKMPDFLDYAGYVFFFPSIFTGPAFDYVDYRRWIETSMFDVGPNQKPAPTRKQRRIPQSGVPATYKAVTGLVWIFLYLQFSGWYNVSLFLSDKYMDYSFLRRVWFLYMLGFTSRLKYYAVWALTEGACIMAGIGYNGIDPATGKPRWDRLENVNAWGIESAQNSRAYLDNWNKNTNKWLRNYVYLRVTPKGKKPGFRATLATFITSAVWHGFYPGYYLTFVLGAFVQTVAKNSRRYIRPFFLTPDGTKSTSYKIYYDIAGYIATQLTFCFVTAPFVLLGFSDSLKVWARVYFYAIIEVAIAMAFFASPAKLYLAKAIDKRNHPYTRKTIAQETNYPPSLGLPSDPGREIDEAVEELRQEVDMRRRRGSGVTMPTGESLKRELEARLGRRIQFPEFKFGQQLANGGGASGLPRGAEQGIEKRKVEKEEGGAGLASTTIMGIDKKTI